MAKTKTETPNAKAEGTTTGAKAEDTKQTEQVAKTQASTAEPAGTEPAVAPAPVVTKSEDELAAEKASSETAAENAEAAIAPAVAGVENDPEVAERTRVALGNVGATPAPTMVNGVYVGDKTYNETTGEWEADPDKAPRVRPADIFDRIGEAFPHERQRLVIEEIARAAGLSDTSTDLPEGMPAAKSTASLRTDVSGYGRFTGGGPGIAPVEVGTDGKAQVEPVDTESGKK